MKKENIIFERKEFLNLPAQHGMANVVAYIVKNRNYDNDELYRNVYCKLDFADCSSVVNMAIDLDDEYARENAIYKVDTLLSVITEFREALIKEAKFQARLEKKRARRDELEKTNKKKN